MESVTQSSKVVYTGKVRSTGGRDNGVARSTDGRLDIQLSAPGSKGSGTNPEQLFAAGWSACFQAAIEIAARKQGLQMPQDASIDTEVDLCLDKADAFLQARLNIYLPGMERGVAQQLVETARQTCPYSKAIHGNVNVAYNLV